MNATSSSKQSIRQLIRERRRNLSADKHQQYAKQLANYLPLHILQNNIQRIGVFLAQDGELNLQPSIHKLWKHQRLTFLPVLKPLPPNRLWFAPYSATSQLIPNRFNILEPNVLPNHMTAPSQLDCVLFPLVAFDLNGGRLGMGGGFYDRTFAHLRKASQRPVFYGVALNEQQVDTIPIESWDIPLDGVATPQGFIEFAGN